MKYLNYVLALFIVLGCTQSANAQDSKFIFGLKGAMNVGWIQAKTKNVSPNGVGLGFSYGIMGDYQFTRNYSISAEFLISNVQGNMLYTGDEDGAVFKNDTAAKQVDNLNYKLNLQYIQLPISMKFRTKEIGYITYWAQFGIAPGFMIGNKADLSGDLPAIIADDDPTDFNLNKEEGDDFAVVGFEDKVFPVRVGLIIGGGIEYSLAGSTSLYTGIRLNNGFTDLFVADKGVDAFNGLVSLNVGLFF